MQDYQGGNGTTIHAAEASNKLSCQGLMPATAQQQGGQVLGYADSNSAAAERGGSGVVAESLMNTSCAPPQALK